jgi:hypothetical protein
MRKVEKLIGEEHSGLRWLVGVHNTKGDGRRQGTLRRVRVREGVADQALSLKARHHRPIVTFVEASGSTVLPSDAASLQIRRFPAPACRFGSTTHHVVPVSAPTHDLHGGVARTDSSTTMCRPSSPSVESRGITAHGGV